MRPLTPKQEAFCLAYLETGNASEAYRRAYDAGRMKPESVNRAAKALVDNSKIAARLADLRKPVIEAAQITFESHLRRLYDLSVAAEQNGQFAAAIAAEVSRGKASGLYTERVAVGGPDGGPLQILGGQLPAGAAAALAERLKRVSVVKG